jgi:hypothetical protein
MAVEIRLRKSITSWNGVLSVYCFATSTIARSSPSKGFADLDNSPSTRFAADAIGVPGITSLFSGSTAFQSARSFSLAVSLAD